jgi:hypothetical protein
MEHIKYQVMKGGKEYYLTARIVLKDIHGFSKFTERGNGKERRKRN